MNQRVDASVSFGRSVVAAARSNRITFHAAGITFYSMLSAFPAAIAAISIFGLFAEPGTLARELEGFAEWLPPAAADLVIEELEALAQGRVIHVGLGAVVSILLTLWTASSAIRAMSMSLDRVYGVGEPRRYLLQRLVSYLLTLGFIAGLVVQGLVVAASPGWLRASAQAEALRWPLLYAAMVAGIALLYRVAPNRPWKDSRWGIAGPMFGAAGILAATAAISVYGRHASNLNSTYGTLAGVVMLMLWFYVTTTTVLLGGEIDVALTREGRGPRTA